VRRRAGVNAGRLDRPQPLGARPDRAAICQSVAADAAAAIADFTEVRDVISVVVREDRAVSVPVLLDPEQLLSERIIAEQFTV
jgi:hypothetical protein